MGWARSHKGIILNARQTAWLDSLAARVPFGLVVTSGVRTAEGQARAMLAQVELGPAGVEQAYRNYDDGLVRQMLALPRTLAAWIPVVEAAYADGRLARGGHYDGGAVDLRTRGLTPAQVEQLQAAVRAVGGRPWLEGAPPHLHVGLPAARPA
jgi:hypothetical protein